MVHHNQNDRKDKNRIVIPAPKKRNLVAEAMSQRNGGGRHHTRTQDVLRGSSRKQKHKNRQDY